MGLSAATIEELFNVILMNIDTRAEVIGFIRRFNLGDASPDLTREKNLVRIQPKLLSETEGIDEIVKFVILKYYNKHPEAGTKDILDNKINDIHEDFPDFVHHLKNDGFVIRNKDLSRVVPKQIESAEIQDELDAYLSKYELIITKGHLDQATDNVRSNNWAAANGQMRTFFESLLINIVKKIDPNSTITSGSSAIDFLAQREFFKRSLNEIDENNTPYGFIKGMWKILHTEGAHPGLSHEGDCIFRYHLLIVTATYYLKRLERSLE